MSARVMRAHDPWPVGHRIGDRVIVAGPERRPYGAITETMYQVRCRCGDVAWVSRPSLLSGRAGRCHRCGVEGRAARTRRMTATCKEMPR